MAFVYMFVGAVLALILKEILYSEPLFDEEDFEKHKEFCKKLDRAEKARRAIISRMGSDD